jgi:hypothetical protein
MKDADRIRLLLKEIWDVRESDDVEREPTLPRLWQELEYLVSQELDHKVTEELALHE